MTFPAPDLGRVNAKLADVDVAALSLGPQQDDEATYWQELAEWADASSRCPDTRRPLPIRDWRQS